MKEVKVEGEVRSFKGFFDFVAQTTRQQRNNMLGSSIVYSTDFDVESVASRVGDLIEHHEKCLDGLKAIKPLIDADVATAKRRKAAIDRLKALSVEELEALTSKD